VAINAIRGDRELVFPWPHHRRHLDRCLEKLLKHAGLSPERWLGTHGFRKSSAFETAEENPMVAQKQLGHLGMKMTSDHYVPPKIQVAILERM
jgi:integrase